MTAVTSRRFRLVRCEDISGVSGTGVVAHGVVFPDGTCALRWASAALASTAVYGNLDTLEAIHGHGGATRIEFIDRAGRDVDTEPLPLPPATRRDLREVRA